MARLLPTIENMKRLCLLAILSLASATAFGNTVVIANREDAVFYFVTAPISDDFYETIRTNGLLAQALLKQNALKLSYIPPMGTAWEVVVAEGTATIVLGFYASPGDVGYPIVAFAVPAEGRDLVYEVDRGRALNPGDEENAVIYPWDISLSREPVRIDGRLVDWTRVEDSISRRPGAAPATFRRADDEDGVELPIDEAFFWERGGTDVESVRAVRSQTHLYLMFEAESNIIDGTSYFLYAHPSRSIEAPNRFTVEIYVTGPSGFVYLWEAGNARPIIIGDYAYDRFFLEARIGRSRLPTDALLFADEETSFDITAALYSAGLVEEFDVGILRLGAVESP